MTNYNENLKNIKTLDSLENLVDSYNNDILDGVEVEKIDFATLDRVVKDINENYFSDFVGAFLTKLDIDRKTAFESLIANPFYTVVFYTVDGDTIKVDSKKSIIKLANLEKEFQLAKSTEINNKGKKIANSGVTIFGSLRFYTVCDAFVRNLFLTHFEVDENKTLNLARVKIGDDTIFTEKDGEAFASNSNKALTKQLNILVKFMGLDVEMWREDVLPLKLSAQKVKIDRDSNKVSIYENGKKNKTNNKKDNTILKFADMLLTVITTRAKFGGVKVYDANGNIIAIADKEDTTK